jgi:hypothetical protein
MMSSEEKTATVIALRAPRTDRTEMGKCAVGRFVGENPGTNIFRPLTRIAAVPAFRREPRTPRLRKEP